MFLFCTVYKLREVNNMRARGLKNVVFPFCSEMDLELFVHFEYQGALKTFQRLSCRNSCSWEYEFNFQKSEAVTYSKKESKFSLLFMVSLYSFTNLSNGLYYNNVCWVILSHIQTQEF